MKHCKKPVSILLFLIFICFSPGISNAQKKSDNSGLIYVPVYSSIYYGDGNPEFDLTVTLTIRNIDMVNSVTVYSVDYYNKSGSLVRSYLKTPAVLKPFETKNFIVNESDTRGGSSASFLIRWDSGKKINDLFVEAVMIGTRQQQGISFTSRGINIKR